ncbi:hypothetical protein EIP86_003884 [Pleurotus ostreatoroseus]|nr:hypothetical protein EIP86_003884 [Pleurotus ostreatoroseus]
MSAIKPPFTAESAREKVKVAQRLWNTRDPQKSDTIWRNRHEFMRGREEVIQFLTRKWEKENGYRLRKELFAWTENKIAVQFWYEWYETKSDGTKQWYRTYGLEDWTYEDSGLMRKRQMSGNDVAIAHEERWFKEDVADEDSVEISERHW